MSPNGYTAEVTGLSPDATEKDVYDFFAFCGTIEHVEIVRASEFGSSAYVTFKEAYALETAVLLSGATILDQRVCITNWGQNGDEFSFWNQPSWKLEDESDSTSSQYNPSMPSPGEVLTAAQDVVKTMLEKGYVLGKDALSKAKSFDESHQVSATAVTKAAEFSERIRLSEKISAGVEAVKSVDQKYHITDVTKTAMSTAGGTVMAAATSVANSGYFSKGALWVSGALTRAAKVAADFGSQHGKSEKLA